MNQIPLEANVADHILRVWVVALLLQWVLLRALGKIELCREAGDRRHLKILLGLGTPRFEILDLRLLLLDGPGRLWVRLAGTTSTLYLTLEVGYLVPEDDGIPILVQLELLHLLLKLAELVGQVANLQLAIGVLAFLRASLRTLFEVRRILIVSHYLLALR